MEESSDSFEVNPSNSMRGSTGSSSTGTPNAANANSYDEESPPVTTGTNSNNIPAASAGRASPGPGASASANDSGRPWSAMSAASKFLTSRKDKKDDDDDDDEDYISSESEEEDNEGLSLDATTINTRDKKMSSTGFPDESIRAILAKSQMGTVGGGSLINNRSKTIILNSRFDEENNDKENDNNSTTNTNTNNSNKDKDDVDDNTIPDPTFATYSAIRSIVYAPNGKTITVGGDRKKVITFSPPTSYTVVNEYKIREGAVLCMTYSPNGKLLYVGGDDEKVTVFSCEGTLLNRFNNSSSIRKSLKNNSSITNTNTNTNTDTISKSISPFPYPNPAPTKSNSYELLYEYEMDGDVEAIAHSPKGNFIAVGGSDKKISIFNTETKELVKEFEVGGWILDLTYSPNGEYLAVAGYDSVGVTEFDLTGHEKKTYYEDVVDDGHRDDFADDSGAGAGAGGRGKEVVHADEEIGKTPSGKSSGIVRSVAYSPDGNYLVMGGSNRKVIVYNVRNHEVVATHVRESEVNAIAFSPDGDYVAVGGDGGKVTIYDAKSTVSKSSSKKSFEVLKEFETEHAVFAIAISPDGNFVSVGGYSQRVTVYNISNPTMLKEFDMNGDVITKIDSEAYRQEIYARNRIDPKKEALSALGMAGCLSATLGMLVLIIYLLE